MIQNRNQWPLRFSRTTEWIPVETSPVDQISSADIQRKGSLQHPGSSGKAGGCESPTIKDEKRMLWCWQTQRSVEHRGSSWLPGRGRVWERDSHRWCQCWALNEALEAGGERRRGWVECGCTSGCQGTSGAWRILSGLVWLECNFRRGWWWCRQRDTGRVNCTDLILLFHFWKPQRGDLERWSKLQKDVWSAFFHLLMDKTEKCKPDVWMVIFMVGCIRESLNSPLNSRNGLAESLTYLGVRSWSQSSLCGRGCHWGNWAFLFKSQPFQSNYHRLKWKYTDFFFFYQPFRRTMDLFGCNIQSKESLSCM